MTGECHQVQTPGLNILVNRRPRYWFWDSVVLVQTLALAASQVLASALDQYFQLTIMLMLLIVGITLLAHLAPFQADLAQRTQARMLHNLLCMVQQ